MCDVFVWGMCGVCVCVVGVCVWCVCVCGVCVCVWCVCVCDLETSTVRRPRPSLGCCAKERKTVLH